MTSSSASSAAPAPLPVNEPPPFDANEPLFEPTNASLEQWNESPRICASPRFVGLSLCSLTRSMRTHAPSTSRCLQPYSRAACRRRRARARARAARAAPHGRRGLAPFCRIASTGVRGAAAAATSASTSAGSISAAAAPPAAPPPRGSASPPPPPRGGARRAACMIAWTRPRPSRPGTAAGRPRATRGARARLGAALGPRELRERRDAQPAPAGAHRAQLGHAALERAQRRVAERHRLEHEPVARAARAAARRPRPRRRRRPRPAARSPRTGSRGTAGSPGAPRLRPTTPRRGSRSARSRRAAAASPAARSARAGPSRAAPRARRRARRARRTRAARRGRRRARRRPA